MTRRVPVPMQTLGKYLLNEQSCETGYPRVLLSEKTEAVRSNHRGGKGVYKPTGSTLFMDGAFLMYVVDSKSTFLLRPCPLLEVASQQATLPPSLF